MAAIEPQAAILRSTLRWYQFSLRGLLFFTLFVAILLSILATGACRRTYEARLPVYRQIGEPVSLFYPTPANKLYKDTEEQLIADVANSDAVMEEVTQLLRTEGVERIDDEVVGPEVVRNHAWVLAGKREWGRKLYCVTASTRNPEQSKMLAKTLFNTWTNMISKLAPAMDSKYLERGRSELSAEEYQRFESSWRSLEEGESGNLPEKREILHRGKRLGKWIDNAACIFDCEDSHSPDEVILVDIEFPFWKPCVAIASIWSALGFTAICLSLWRRFRTNRVAKKKRR